MSRYEDSCPFEPQARANRCQSCVATAELPPSAIADLTAPDLVRAPNVLPLLRVVPQEMRKAA